MTFEEIIDRAKNHSRTKVYRKLISLNRVFKGSYIVASKDNFENGWPRYELRRQDKHLSCGYKRIVAMYTNSNQQTFLY